MKDMRGNFGGITMLETGVNSMFNNILSALSINHLSLCDATLQLGNLSQNCVLVGQNVVHLLCNLLL